MSDIERLVLEKHQLIQQLRSRDTLLIALTRKAQDDKGVVRVTKAELEAAAKHTVEVTPLKHGAKLTVKETADE